MKIIVIGDNKIWKQEINIGSRTNQNFVSIPHSNLIKTIVPIHIITFNKFKL